LELSIAASIASLESLHAIKNYVSIGMFIGMNYMHGLVDGKQSLLKCLYEASFWVFLTSWSTRSIVDDTRENITMTVVQ